MEEKEKKPGFLSALAGKAKDGIGKAVGGLKLLTTNILTRKDRHCEEKFNSSAWKFTLFSSKDASEGLSIYAQKDRQNSKLTFLGSPDIKNGAYLVDDQGFIFYITELEKGNISISYKDEKIAYATLIAYYKLEDKENAPNVVNNYINASNNLTIVDSVVNGDINQSLELDIKTNIEVLTEMIQNSEQSDKLVGLIEELKELVEKRIPTPPGKLARFASFMTKQMFSVVGQVLAALATSAINQQPTV